MKFSMLVLMVFTFSSAAKAETATYQGLLNGKTIVLKFEVAGDSSAVVSHFIPCQTPNDESCAGPGTYAFFDQSGTATVSYDSKSLAAPINFAFYVRENETQNGSLNGNFKFTDRTNLPSSVDEDDSVRGYQFSLEQYGTNPVVISLSQNRVVGFSFPLVYTLNWVVENGGFGSVVLNRLP